jgi:hypothetical protein
MSRPLGFFSALAVLTLVAVWAGSADGALETDRPYHGGSWLRFGGEGELRFGYDLDEGVSNPDWFSVGRAGGFVEVEPGGRFHFALEGAYDRGIDDFTLERAEMIARLRPSMDLHAGVFLAPLGTTNRSHDAPVYEFAERSLVATQLIGVPYAELGAGVRTAWNVSWEIDVVTGYDEGIVTASPGATRVPSGRNNYGDTNGIPALAGQLLLRPSQESEITLAAQSGQYNETTPEGTKLDDPRFAHLFVADGAFVADRFHVFGEGAMALVDVPPSLEGIYAQRQWGGSVEVWRTLREPIFAGWHGSSMTAALRADAVDFDTELLGDSRSRLSASLNLHHHRRAVARFGWYYELRRDRFNNETPLAGLTLTMATYF